MRAAPSSGVQARWHNRDTTAITSIKDLITSKSTGQFLPDALESCRSDAKDGSIRFYEQMHALELEG